MAFLDSLFSKSRTGESRSSNPETAPVKMNLEERMAFRRELLFETIKLTMESMGIMSASYKFKVVRTDKRGHCFAVMVDLCDDFLHGPQGAQDNLVRVGAMITQNASTRYGLVVIGVYWRVNEELRGFDASRPAPAASVAPSVPPAEVAEPEPERVGKFSRATADELAAFEAAWRENNEMRIGDRTYSSDLAPLGDDSNPTRSR